MNMELLSCRSVAKTCPSRDESAPYQLPQGIGVRRASYFELCSAICDTRTANRNIDYIIRNRRYTVPRRVRDMTIWDNELSRRLRNESSVTCIARADGEGIVRAHGLEWQGGKSYRYRTVELTFCRGKLCELAVHSQFFKHSPTTPKMAERVKLTGCPSLSTELSPTELMVEFASVLRMIERRSTKRTGPLVSCTIDDHRITFRVNQKSSMWRLEKLFARMLHQERVSFEAWSAKWSSFSVYKLPSFRIAAQVPQLRRFRATYENGKRSELAILSLRIRHSNGSLKAEECIDFRSEPRRRWSELTDKELVSAVNRSGARGKGRQPVLLAFDGETHLLSICTQVPNRYERLLQERMRASPEVAIVGITNHLGHLYVLGFRHDCGKSHSHEAVRLLFRRGREKPKVMADARVIRIGVSGIHSRPEKRGRSYFFSNSWSAFPIKLKK